MLMPIASVVSAVGLYVALLRLRPKKCDKDVRLVWSPILMSYDYDLTLFQNLSSSIILMVS